MPPEVEVPLRVRLDECDATRSARLSAMIAMADEARFSLYDAIADAGFVLPPKHAARAESLVVHRAPGSREALVVRAHLAHVGRTSYRIAHRATSASGEPLFDLASTLVSLAGGRPAELDPSLRGAVGGAMDLAVDPPGELDSGAAFLRTFDAMASHENQGGHVARTRIVDWLDDLRRLAFAREAFEIASPAHGGRVAGLALVYDRELFAGDALRAGISAASAHALDALLAKGREPVCRARFTCAR